MAPSLKVGSLGEYLREQRHSAQLSLRQLADLAGVSNPYLSQVERGLRKPSAEVLQQLAKGLRISAEALYVRAGLLEEPGVDRTVEAAIVSDPILNERQKRVLLDIYASFRRENAAHAERASRASETPPRKATSRKAAPRKRSVRKAAATKASARRSAKVTQTQPDTPQE